MAVYVDDMSLPATVPNGRNAVRGRWSHLFADTRGELMRMAETIGLNPRWIQHEGTPGEHFDVVMSKRAAAIRAGARPVTWREAGEYLRAENARPEKRNTAARTSGAQSTQEATGRHAQSAA